MIRKRRVIICATLTIIFTFVSVISFLMNSLVTSQNEVKFSNKEIEEMIKYELTKLPEKYKLKNLVFDNITATFINNVYMVPSSITDIKKVWEEVNSWAKLHYFVNITSQNLSTIINSLKHAKIKYADIDRRGTQLKLLLTLEGEQQIVFKPKWYDKNKVIQGPIYAGKDRYGSEILAFYLSIILNKPLVPISVERNISLKREILPVGSKLLLNTSFHSNNKTCIYGKCYYCTKEDPVCTDDNADLSGAAIFNLNLNFKNNRSPWQRTYKKSKPAVWQENPDYCEFVKKKLPKGRILDLIELSIFDFLLQNGDRHHYEVLGNTVVYVDNGKGLGNPYDTVLDILAPLYQCCMLRKNAWERLKLISGGFLTEKLKLMPDIKNFIADEHINAIEERLLIVYATIEYCRNKSKYKLFL